MLIGLNGNKGSGKDTVGAYLVENYGYERLSFAEKLKDSAGALFDVEPILWDVWKNDPHAKVALINDVGKILNRTRSMTVREFLQRYGTESHRDVFGQDFWVDHAIKGIDPNKNYVFTDARFDNELQKIKDLGGMNIRIIGRGSNGDSHVSEAEPSVNLIDYRVDNTSTFESLYKLIDSVMEDIKLREYEEEYDFKHDSPYYKVNI